MIIVVIFVSPSGSGVVRETVEGFLGRRGQKIADNESRDQGLGLEPTLAPRQAQECVGSMEGKDAAGHLRSGGSGKETAMDEVPPQHCPMVLRSLRVDLETRGEAGLDLRMDAVLGLTSLQAPERWLHEKACGDKAAHWISRETED